MTFDHDKTMKTKLFRSTFKRDLGGTPAAGTARGAVIFNQLAAFAHLGAATPSSHTKDSEGSLGLVNGSAPETRASMIRHHADRAYVDLSAVDAQHHHHAEKPI